MPKVRVVSPVPAPSPDGNNFNAFPQILGRAGMIGHGGDGRGKLQIQPLPLACCPAMVLALSKMVLTNV